MPCRFRRIRFEDLFFDRLTETIELDRWYHRLFSSPFLRGATHLGQSSRHDGHAKLDGDASRLGKLLLHHFHLVASDVLIGVDRSNNYELALLLLDRIAVDTEGSRAEFSKRLVDLSSQVSLPGDVDGGHSQGKRNQNEPYDSEKGGFTSSHSTLGAGGPKSHHQEDHDAHQDDAAQIGQEQQQGAARDVELRGAETVSPPRREGVPGRR